MFLSLRRATCGECTNLFNLSIHGEPNLVLRRRNSIIVTWKKNPYQIKKGSGSLSRCGSVKKSEISPVKKLYLSSSDTEVGEKKIQQQPTHFIKDRKGELGGGMGRGGVRTKINGITMETRCLKSRDQFLLCPFKLSSDC